MLFAARNALRAGDEVNVSLRDVKRKFEIGVTNENEPLTPVSPNVGRVTRCSGASWFTGSVIEFARGLYGRTAPPDDGRGDAAAEGVDGVGVGFGAGI